MFRHERRVKKAILLLTLTSLVAGCERRTVGGPNTPQPTTQTIAPAAAQPAPTGTDAMTQTVELEDSRSEEEGGVMTKPSAPAKAAPAPKTKKKGKK